MPRLGDSNEYKQDMFLSVRYILVEMECVPY